MLIKLVANSDKVQFIEVTELHDGQRLDNYLMRSLKGVPRSRVYRLIRKGEVRVNKKRCKPEQRLEPGDTIRIPPFFGVEPAAPGMITEGLKQLLIKSVIWEEEGALALNKPEGLAVHGGTGIRLGLVEALRQIRAEWQHAELVHRLDRDTSGVLLVAKNPKYLKDLQEQFKARTVKKQYLALVHGAWPAEITEVNAPLRKNEIAGGERVVKIDPDGKPAITQFQVLERFAHASLIAAHPETGRTHQIRVHCLSAGCPIVGDNKYIHSAHEGGDTALNKAKSVCLHAAKLDFRAGENGPSMSLEAPLGGRFLSLLEQLRGNAEIP